MRISDWSSDVCSSDLAGRARRHAEGSDSSAIVAVSDPARARAFYGHVLGLAPAPRRQHPCRRRLEAGLAEGSRRQHPAPQFDVGRLPPTPRLLPAGARLEWSPCPLRGASMPPVDALSCPPPQIGRAHVCTPVTNAHLV